MRSRRLVQALAALLLLVGGCGMPGETRVTRDGAAPRGLLWSGTPDTAWARPREQSHSPEQIVENYLRAAAGEREPKSAVDRVRSFLPLNVRAGYNPNPEEILVVRQIGELVPSLKPGTDSHYTVPVKLQVVGILTGQGAVRPPGPQEQSMIDYPFEVSRGQDGLYLNNPYFRLLLSTSALAPVPNPRPDQDVEVLYRPHLLYFWDTRSHSLVPDLRYLSRSIPMAQRPTEVVHRLVRGPSEWLTSAVQALPLGSDVRGNVVLKGERLVVDLNAKSTAAGAIPAPKLLAQLRWSLWDLHYGPIVLQIEGQEWASDASSSGSSAYKNDNPAAALSPTPDTFCIVDGVVVAGCTDTSPQPAPLVLQSPDNKAVVSAAITSRGQDTYAALVRRAAGNRRSLVIGRAKQGETAPTYVSADLDATSITRPLWLNQTDPRPEGLVAAGGRLYHFDSTGTVKPLGVAGINGIQAVAAAPDGRRIAFIAGGAVYVAPLLTQGGSFAVGRPQRLETTLGGLAAGVGFSRPERLVVAGQGWLAELSVDGAVEERFYSLGNNQVTALAAHPDSPADSRSTRGQIMIEVGGVASYQVFASRLQQILWSRPAPSPSPSQNTTTGNSQVPVTAPFYEG